MCETTTALTYTGNWDRMTTDVPALLFMKQYVAKIDGLDLSGPFHNWYSPSCQFYNADGKIYNSGEAIWDWMKGLFGAFSAIRHDIPVVRLFKLGSGNDSFGKDSQWVMFETVTKFTLGDKTLAGEAITVPRLLMFLIGTSEVDGQGTGGLQIREAKAWWDSGVLMREIAARKEKVKLVKTEDAP